MQIQQQTTNENEQQKQPHIQKRLININKRDVIIGFVSGMLAGILVYIIAPTLFHMGVALLAWFIDSIQQPQMANAWQSIGGIIETITALIAVSLYVRSRIKRKRETEKEQKTEDSP